MRRFGYLSMTGGCLILLTLLIIMCGGGGNGSGPSYTQVTLNGTIEFAGDDQVDAENIITGLGDNYAVPDSNFEFSITGNQHVAGLMFALDESDSIPVFIAIVPDPVKALDVDLDIRSTAMALIFLNPFVCTSEIEEAKAVIDTIENLSQFNALVDVLEDKCADDCKAWTYDDSEIDNAINAVVGAFLETFPNSPAGKSASKIVGLPKIASPLKDGVLISPTTETAGHLITHEGGSEFTATNAYGRWAYCVLPDGEGLWLTPNGQMFDFFKDGLPWAPSEKEFSLTVEAGADPLNVNIYGLGWRGDADNLWGTLSQEEQLLCLEAGLATISLEFGGHLVSLYGNLKSGLTAAGRWEGITDEEIWDLLDFIKSDVAFMANVKSLVQAGNWGELFYVVANKVVTNFIKDPEYRNAWFKIIGKTLSQESVDRISRVVVNRAAGAISFGAIVGESVTSLMKTYVGITSSRFKTNFQIWKVVGDFGNVEGGIFDKDDGKPIEGATVHLLGDDDNPLNPAHTYSTDNLGGYYFENILIGSKQLVITKTGYKTKTVDITIQKSKTIEKDFELEKIYGNVSGRILNEIRMGNNMSDSLFKDDVQLFLREIAGEEREMNYTISDGDYNVRVFPGEWWIVAEHDDYHNDSLQVTVEEDKTATGRDLVLRPEQYFYGTFEVDMNNDGIYEIKYDLTFEVIAATPPVTLTSCPTQGHSTTDVIMIGAALSNTDEIYITFNLDEVSSQSSGADMGTIADVVCTNTGVGATLIYITSRYECNDDGDTDPITFGLPGGPYYGSECNCEVNNFGSVSFYSFGEETTDIIRGFTTIATYPAWKNCECEGEDTDDDGVDDEWDVECARGRFDLEFKAFVGTNYTMSKSSVLNKIINSENPGESFPISGCNK